MNHMSFNASRAIPVDVPDHIVLIGNSPPRRCGIATFTDDCRSALLQRFPNMRIDYYAMDNGKEGIAYPTDVHPIAQDDPVAYSEAARDIEASGADAIWLQHEFGIFGGAAGEYILRLLARTTLPLVTTLHTVLEKPSTDEDRVFRAILERSSQLIVMAEKGRDMLRQLYGVADSRIRVVPHGVPDRPLVEPDVMKAQFGLEGRKIILTFGLLAPDKGIDSMIRAMPAIARKHPEALYIVLGATHPNVVQESGEALRHELEQLATSLGVGEHVAFVDRYLDLPDLLDYLQATDIYVTPYYNPAQVTSGTLSYAVALGKPVVSTPYVHATEILGSSHGMLVPFRDSGALFDAVDTLLSDDDMRGRHARQAYEHGRSMLWTTVAEKAAAMLGQAQQAKVAHLTLRSDHDMLDPDIQAVVRMSDGTGMMQHSIFSVPDRNHGYCLDDNARALILMSQVENLHPTLRDRWTATYASFIQHCWNEDAGRFRNFMRYDRSWCEEVGSDDSFGRAVWALGVTARDAANQQFRDWACHLLDTCLKPAGEITSPRAQAFIMLGCAALIEARGHHEQAATLVDRFGTHMLALLAQSRRPDWAWFEAILAYDNARLPEALLRAAAIADNKEFAACGLQTLAWIIERQTAPDGHFRAVGTESFGRRHAAPLPFDQQPLEAQATIEACAAAYAVDRGSRWIGHAHSAYGWYLGRNDLSQPLATIRDGGCYDGLMPHGVNRNQGAESILALQLSSCAMKKLNRAAEIVPGGNRTQPTAVPA